MKKFMRHIGIEEFTWDWQEFNDHRSGALHALTKMIRDWANKHKKVHYGKKPNRAEGIGVDGERKMVQAVTLHNPMDLQLRFFLKVSIQYLMRGLLVIAH